MTYRPPDEAEARAILDAIAEAELSLPAGRGELIYLIETRGGKNARGFMVTRSEPANGFTLGNDLDENQHVEVEFEDVARISLLGYL